MTLKPYLACVFLVSACGSAQYPNECSIPLLYQTATTEGAFEQVVYEGEFCPGLLDNQGILDVEISQSLALRKSLTPSTRQASETTFELKLPSEETHIRLTFSRPAKHLDDTPERIFVRGIVR